METRRETALWSPPPVTCAGHGRCNLYQGHVDPDGRPIPWELPTWVRESVEAMGLVLESAGAVDVRDEA